MGTLSVDNIEEHSTGNVGGTTVTDMSHVFIQIFGDLA